MTRLFETRNVVIIVKHESETAMEDGAISTVEFSCASCGAPLDTAELNKWLTRFPAVASKCPNGHACTINFADLER